MKLFSGMTLQQQEELVKEAARYNFSKKRPYKEIWVSPVMGKGGQVKVEVPKGLYISPEMKDLYKVLKHNGFDVYICSASEEKMVEAVATDSRYGLGIDRNHIYGLRTDTSATGEIVADFNKTYIQTYKGGKTKAIMKYIAPKHCGRGPVLVAGDSNGDYSMLTELKDIKVGLIINCNNTGDIGELTKRALADKKKQHRPVYIVQDSPFN